MNSCAPASFLLFSSMFSRKVRRNIPFASPSSSSFHKAACGRLETLDKPFFPFRRRCRKIWPGSTFLLLLVLFNSPFSGWTGEWPHRRSVSLFDRPEHDNQASGRIRVSLSFLRDSSLSLSKKNAPNASPPPVKTASLLPSFSSLSFRLSSRAARAPTSARSPPQRKACGGLASSPLSILFQSWSFSAATNRAAATCR